MQQQDSQLMTPSVNAAACGSIRMSIQSSYMKLNPRPALSTCKQSRFDGSMTTMSSTAYLVGPLEQHTSYRNLARCSADLNCKRQQQQQECRWTIPFSRYRCLWIHSHAHGPSYTKLNRHNRHYCQPARPGTPAAAAAAPALPIHDVPRTTVADSRCMAGDG